MVWGVVTTVHPPAPPTVPVLVAQRDLVPGTVVSDDDVRAVPRPVDAVPVDVVSDPAAVVGRTVSFPVRSGEPMAARHIVGVELLATLGPGMVATPVTLADPGAAALVSRGDVVDVLAAAPGSATGTPTAAVVASRVRVLIAPTVPAAAAGGLLGSGGSAAGAAASSALVLATTTEQALAIARAAVGSRLSLTLRGA